jgi:RHS repeat-associated protein
LDDGENSYVYGLGRISQTDTDTEYFLSDALGSVRQLTNTAGEITLAKSYNPYGEVTHTAGSGQSMYAYTGEQLDASGLTYLRARYYDANVGRFTSRDTWSGNYNSPHSLNRWNYTNGNPINYIDPSGHNGIPTGGVIAYCFGIAVVVVVDGPSLEILCALMAATIIGTASFRPSPEVIEEVIENCVVTWEQLYNNVAVNPNPNPNQRPTPKPIESVQPPPPYIPTPQPTPTKELRKHVALGRWEFKWIRKFRHENGHT